MISSRIAFTAPLRLRRPFIDLTPTKLLSIPGVRLAPSPEGEACEVTLALTVAEVHAILDTYPISERAREWRSFWQYQFQCWLTLSVESLASWLDRALSSREMYPLLYVIPPQNPSAECLILLDRMPEEAALRRSTAVLRAVEQALGANNWRLLNNLLPLVGRFQVQSCLPILLPLVVNDSFLAKDPPAEEGLCRSLFRCLASFTDRRLIPCFRRGLEIKEVADISFSALVDAGEHLNARELTYITRHFEADESYLLTLYSRFLEGSISDSQKAIAALDSMQQTARQRRFAPDLASMLEALHETYVFRTSRSARSPTRREIAQSARSSMKDLRLPETDIRPAEPMEDRPSV